MGNCNLIECTMEMRKELTGINLDETDTIDLYIRTHVADKFRHDAPLEGHVNNGILLIKRKYF